MITGNPIYRNSERFAFLVLAAFLFMVGFHTGRLTNSQVTLRSSCDLSYDDRQDLKPDWYLTGAR